MQSVFELAHRHAIPVHVDGARLFNAAVALRTDAASIACFADSISFCVSKGLSAPVGSLLCGTSEWIERARRFRRMVGGNMRQAGALAAAGIIALETMSSRLADDHATARRLARGLHEIEPTLVDLDTVETNIVRVVLPPNGRSAAQCSRALEGRGVLVSPCDEYALRFVTHRHIGEAEVDATLAACALEWKSI
jgi:threonine aldolase